MGNRRVRGRLVAGKNRILVPVQNLMIFPNIILKHFFNRIEVRSHNPKAITASRILLLYMAFLYRTLDLNTEYGNISYGNELRA